MPHVQKLRPGAKLPHPPRGPAPRQDRPVDGQRVFDVTADGTEGLVAATAADGTPMGVAGRAAAETDKAARRGPDAIVSSDAPFGPGCGHPGWHRHFPTVTADERIALETEDLLPASVAWEWTGDQEEQAEGMGFLDPLGLMFVILPAPFDTFRTSILVLLAVIPSTAGVLIEMLRGQSKSRSSWQAQAWTRRPGSSGTTSS